MVLAILNYHIRGQASPPYEQVLGSYTRRKLTQLPIGISDYT